MDTKILVVDDDIRINELLCDIFTMEGFNVICAYDGESAINFLDADNDIKIVILDIMLPKIDGWELLGYIKDNFDVKVLMLTALGDEEDEVRGIRNGADDYVIKPFKRAVLLERVRRLSSAYDERINCNLSFNELTVNQRECRVTVKGEEIKLTTKEYQLLLLLMKNSKIVLKRETILDKIWGFEYEGNERTIDTHIKMLRHSLGDYGEYIRTIRGTGYSFDAEVSEK